MTRFKTLLQEFKSIRLLQRKDLKIVSSTNNLPHPENPPSELQTCDPKNMSQQDKTTFIYSDAWKENEVLGLASTGQYPCLLNSNSPFFESHLRSSLLIQTNPSEFLTNPLPFLFQNEPLSLTLSFQKKSDKLEMMKQFEAFVSLTKSQLALDNVRILFQELFMNALYDAPNEAKKLGFAADKKSRQMLFAFDSDKLIISCFDPYGSLDPLSLIKRIEKIIHSNTTQMINFDPNKGGAGIGCSLLYRYSSHLSLVVEEGKRTRVTCTIPLKMSQRKFELLEKNIQYIKMTKSGGVYEKQRNA